MSRPKLLIYILVLVIGVGLLISAIPYSIINLVAGVNQLDEGIVSGGASVYIGLSMVIVGFILTTIGSVKVFRR